MLKFVIKLCVEHVNNFPRKFKKSFNVFFSLSIVTVKVDLLKVPTIYNDFYQNEGL